jgi:hypothetical protein
MREPHGRQTATNETPRGRSVKKLIWGILGAAIVLGTGMEAGMAQEPASNRDCSTPTFGNDRSFPSATAV